MTDDISIGNVIGYMGLLATAFGVWKTGRDVRIQNEASAKAASKELKDEFAKHADDADTRLTKLETKTAEFMPRAEIEQRIEHLKVNRQTVENAMSIQLEKLNAGQVQQGIQIGKLEERHDGMAATMGEVKGLIKDLAADMKAGFKDIADRKPA